MYCTEYTKASKRKKKKPKLVFKVSSKVKEMAKEKMMVDDCWSQSF